MIYVIIEDSKSGKDFWGLACEIFWKNDSFDIRTSKGNQSLKAVFDETIEDCVNLEDSIVLIFDNVSNTSSFNPGNLIMHCKELCRNKNIHFVYSDFYCFESIFLSYSEMLNMTLECKCRAIIKEAIKYVNKAITQGIGYWDSTDDIIDKFLIECKIEASNREHFEAELLSIGTKAIGYGHFHIKKESLKNGECWVKSCEEIKTEMNPFLIDKDCNSKCKCSTRMQSTANKVEDIFNKSILKDSSLADFIQRKGAYDKSI